MQMSIVNKAIGDRRFKIAFAMTLALLTVLLVPAHSAYADIAGDINNWLAELLRDAANWMFSKQVDVLKGIGYDGILGADFSSMLTTSGSVSMYDIAHGVWRVAILPIGCGVLSLVFTVKLIQISQRVDGNASMPGVKEVVFLLVFFAVFLFLIQHSFELMQSIYEVIGIAIDRVMALFGTGAHWTLRRCPSSPPTTTSRRCWPCSSSRSSAGWWCWPPTSSPWSCAGLERCSSTSWRRSAPSRLPSWPWTTPGRSESGI